eukprot:TRINITY_DN6916_c0_g1_i1.p1 TRINITY_DN6916_c0_g1~~TRINITY_DN6916_c0_g1_i1.p1  ORF type:complete len:474 (+),score=67.94 TRINITY_DN6916_c0_g1_i1:713-2134(+)
MCLEYLREFMKLDNIKASLLLVTCFTSEHALILSALDVHPRLLFSYLNGLYMYLSQREEARLTRDPHFRLPTKLSDAAEQLLSFHFQGKEEEKFISLMCKYQKSSVCAYLKSHTNYDVDRMLALVLESEIEESVVSTPRKITDFGVGSSIITEITESASAYLNEKIGNISEAVRIYIKQMEEMMESVITEIFHLERVIPFDPKSHPFYQSEKNLQSLLSTCTDVIKRKSKLCSETEEEDMWLGVLDSFVSYLRKTKEVNREDEQFKEKRRRVKKLLLYSITSLIENIQNSIPVSRILEKLLAHKKVFNLKNFRGVLVSLLESLRCERNLFSCTRALFDVDYMKKVEERMNACHRPVSMDKIVFCKPKKRPALVFDPMDVFREPFRDPILKDFIWKTEESKLETARLLVHKEFIPTSYTAINSEKPIDYSLLKNKKMKTNKIREGAGNHINKLASVKTAISREDAEYLWRQEQK